MVSILMQHQFWAAVGLYWIFSAAVSAMPEPGAGTSSGYMWLFRFVHTVAGNITTVFGNRLPGLKAITIPGLLLCLTGCAVHYTVHPGAVNTTDSVAYDTLRIAQAAIDQAKTENLPPAGKDAVNSLIKAYNIARESWLTYRGAIAANVPSDQYFQQLNNNISDLSIAIRALKEIKQ